MYEPNLSWAIGWITFFIEGYCTILYVLYRILLSVFFFEDDFHIVDPYIASKMLQMTKTNHPILHGKEEGAGSVVRNAINSRSTSVICSKNCQN